MPNPHKNPGNQTKIEGTDSLLGKTSNMGFSLAVTFISLDWRLIFKDLLQSYPLK
jgi:hypothetical protein